MSVDFGEATQYSLELSRDVKRGLTEKVKMGFKPGKALLGYLNDRFGLKGEKKIFADPDRFERVREMWKMLLSEAYTVPEIQKVANYEWGLTTSEGRTIARSTLYSLFTRIDYSGHFYWKGVLHKGRYPDMITLDEFDRAQEILGRKGKPRPSRHEHTYTGLIRCGECGCMITAEPPKTKFIKSTGQTRTYHYLRCTKKSRQQRCSQKYIRVSELESQIRSHLSRIHISQDMLDWVNDKLKRRSLVEQDASPSETAKLTKAIEENTHKKNVLADKLLTGKVSDEVFAEQQKRLDEAGIRLQHLKKKATSKHQKVNEKTKSSFSFAANAPERFENAPKDTKKKMLIRLGSNYSLTDGKLDFQLKKTFRPIQNSLFLISGNTSRLEPNDRRFLSGKTPGLVDKIPVWSSTLDQVRNIFLEDEDADLN